jgi:hypothetical protein
MTKSQIILALEMEGEPVSDACAAELSDSDCCVLADVDGQLTLLINDSGVRIMAKHEANPNAVNIADKIIDDDEFRYQGA